MTARYNGGTAAAVPRRLRWKAGATILAAAMVTAGAAIVLPGTASALDCTTGGSGPQGSCTSAANATLASGTMNMAAPATLAWSGTASAAAQTLYDTLNPDVAGGDSDTYLEVIDLRGLTAGTGAGWSITAGATAFTGAATGIAIPTPAGGTVLAFGGGGTAGTAVNVPSSVCVTAGACVPAAQAAPLTYPVSVPTTALGSTSTIYSADAGTGTGDVLIGQNVTNTTGANPAVWSVAIPTGLPADVYASTITTTVAVGP